MMETWPKPTWTAAERRSAYWFMYLRNGGMGLASGMAGPRSTNDSRTQSFSISWPCFSLCRICSQEGFLYMMTKMPPTVQYYFYSYGFQGKKKNMNLFLHSGNQVLEEVSPWPTLSRMAIPGPVSMDKEIEHTGHTWVICLLLVPGDGVIPSQITLQKR